MKAALLPLRLIGQGPDLQIAIRSELERRRQRAELDTKRRKLLELYYADQIPADLFAEEQERITKSIDALEGRADGETPPPDGLAEQFERVAAILSELDVDQIWEAATESEQRILLDEYVSSIHVFADHLEVEVRGAPKINVAPHEVGLRNRSVENAGVGGGT